MLCEPMPCQWWVEMPSVYGEMTIIRTPQMSGPDLYKVMKRVYCLSKTGEWDFEPIPSSRTEEYLSSHRFGTFEEALVAARKAPSV